jgi:hypothetical protein
MTLLWLYRLIIGFELSEFEFTTEETCSLALELETSIEKSPTIIRLAVYLYALTAVSFEAFGLSSDKVSQVPGLSSLRRFIRVKLFLCPEFNKAFKLKTNA